MDRLQHRKKSSDDSHDGELVTREDGSQVMRVRRRKRRSRQPHKEAQVRAERVRKVRVIAISALVFALVLLSGAWLLYTNSSVYRNSLVEKLKGMTGAEVELRQFRVTPVGANAGRLALKWPEGSYFNSLQLLNFHSRVNLDSYLRSSLQGSELVADAGQLVLQSGSEAGEAKAQLPQPDKSEPISFDRVSAKKLNIFAGSPEQPFGRVWETYASFIKHGLNGKSQLQLAGGVLRVLDWPDFALDRSHIEVSSDALNIVSLYLKPYFKEEQKIDASGSMLLKGAITPKLRDTASVCSVELDTWPLAALVGKNPAMLIDGLVDSRAVATSNFFSMVPSKPEETSLELAIQSSPLSEGMKVMNFPFLQILADELDYQWLKKPVFRDVSEGLITMRKQEIIFSDLNLENRGRMIIEGTVKITQPGSLSGELRVGVNSAVVEDSNKDSSKRLTHVFGKVSNGYQWVTIKLSGTCARPADDFAETLKRAQQAQSQDLDPSNAPGFLDLTTPQR